MRRQFNETGAPAFTNRSIWVWSIGGRVEQSGGGGEGQARTAPNAAPGQIAAQTTAPRSPAANESRRWDFVIGRLLERACTRCVPCLPPFGSGGSNPGVALSFAEVVVVDLNADVGEGFDADSALVLLVTSVNVACGFHAGDEKTMRGVCEAPSPRVLRSVRTCRIAIATASAGVR